MEKRLPRPKRTIYSLYIKRALDIILSVFAIVVLSPVFLILIILELLFHGWPVFFSQERPGLEGKIFKLYKFRSMTNETDREGNLLPGEQRLTKFGKFIRRFSLDELPELFCILTGKMSVIGPRPLLSEYMNRYSERHKMRHSVRPGLACPRLVGGNTWTWNDQFENDIYYIEHISFWLDIRMVFAVVKEALIGKEYRVEDTREIFMGNNLDIDAWKND